MIFASIAHNNSFVGEWLLVGMGYILTIVRMYTSSLGGVVSGPTLTFLLFSICSPLFACVRMHVVGRKRRVVGHPNIDVNCLDTRIERQNYTAIKEVLCNNIINNLTIYWFHGDQERKVKEFLGHMNFVKKGNRFTLTCNKTPRL